jgi:hypothetical protein
VLSFPTSYYAEKTGLKALYDFAESGSEIPTTSVAISREFGKKNRDTVLSFLRAYLEGHKRLLTDRALSIRALQKYGGIADEETLAHTYNLFSTKIIRKVPTISAKSVENALSCSAKPCLKPGSAKPANSSTRATWMSWSDRGLSSRCGLDSNSSNRSSRSNRIFVRLERFERLEPAVRGLQRLTAGDEKARLFPAPMITEREWEFA